MAWKTYKKQFSKTANEAGFNQSYIDKWLVYAKVLFQQKLPIIYDQNHFSQLVGLELEYILAATNSPKHFYRTFRIPKNNGGMRTIKEPLPDLKTMQKWIASEILSNCKVSEYTKAYRTNISIRDNAKFHINQNVLLSMDIEDYFHSIPFHKVYSLFLKLGYRKNVAVLLSNLCCLNNYLPQGAPTSPILSNILTKIMDNDIAEYCNKNKLRYTRYADDITISGDFDPKTVIFFLNGTLKKHNFKTNSNKTKVKYFHERQLVTGVTVNSKLQAPRINRKELRKTMHFINKFSLESHMSRRGIDDDKEYYIKHLLGKANHMYFLNNNDTEIKRYINQLHSLLEVHSHSS